MKFMGMQAAEYLIETALSKERLERKLIAGQLREKREFSAIGSHVEFSKLSKDILNTETAPKKKTNP